MDQGTSRGAKPDSRQDDADSDTPSFLELRFNFFKALVVGSHRLIQRFDLLDEFADFNGVDIQGTTFRRDHQRLAPSSSFIGSGKTGFALTTKLPPGFAATPVQIMQALSLSFDAR
jgi:hypothetical protein